MPLTLRPLSLCSHLIWVGECGGSASDILERGSWRSFASGTGWFRRDHITSIRIDVGHGVQRLRVTTSMASVIGTAGWWVTSRATRSGWLSELAWRRFDDVDASVMYELWHMLVRRIVVNSVVVRYAGRSACMRRRCRRRWR